MTELRILRAGICGTDLQIQRRVRADAAGTLGHEGVAERMGEDDRAARFVIFNPVNQFDQSEILGHSYAGIFQRTYRMPARRSGTPVPDLFPANPVLPADLAPLVEPLATVLYGWDLVRSVREVRRLAVWGGGSAALLAAVVGEIQGCAVELLHRRTGRLDFIRRSGLVPRTRLRRHDEPDSAVDVDAAFICVPREGAPSALGHALARVAPGGCVDLLGGFGPGDRHPALGPVDLGGIRRANVCGRNSEPAAPAAMRTDGRVVHLTGHRGTSHDHLSRAQDLLLSHPERFAPFITHVVSLEQAPAVLGAMAASGAGALPGEYVKVVVDPTLTSASFRPPDMSVRLAELVTVEASC